MSVIEEISMQKIWCVQNVCASNCSSELQNGIQSRFEPSVDSNIELRKKSIRLVDRIIDVLFIIVDVQVV